MTEPLQLTEPQLAVLRVVWARGEASVPDVWKALYAERGLAQSTVATMVARLAQRGVLARRPDPDAPRQYLYRATASEAEVRASMVRELTAVLFDGDSAALVNHLVRSDQLRPGDLDAVRRLLDAAGPDPEEDDDAG